MTFKSGSFVFSGKYSEKRLHDLLLGAEILTKTVCELPTLPAIVSRINPQVYFRNSSTRGESPYRREGWRSHFSI